MVKLYSRLQVFMLCLLCSFATYGQINTPSGAIIPFGSNKSYQYGIMPGNLPTGGAYGSATDAANAYNSWKSNYVVACGSQYRVKFDDPNQTVSEGIAYGMLLAAYAADKALFDGLWAYYKTNSNNNGNGVMNWKISGCNSPVGNNGATDAELDAAMALLVADAQWPLATSPYDYTTEATTLINKIKNLELDQTNFQVTNGDAWGSGTDCRNPSYQAPAYYKIYASAVPADATLWGTNAVNGAYTLINANANSTTGLVSDWCNKSGAGNACQSGSSLEYGYDACRNPWRMATDVIWNNESRAATLCGKLATYLNGVGAANCGGPRQQNGSGSGGHYATFVSTFAAGVMGSTNQTLLNAMYTQAVGVTDYYQNAQPSGYFGNTLRCVSLFMLTGNFWKPGTSLTPEINVQLNGTNVASGGSIDLGNVQQGTNGDFTFTIQNLGQQSLTVNNVTISGTGASKFSITTQPASPVNANSTKTFVVRFTPGANTTGQFTAQLSIGNNDATGSENPYLINILATGTQNPTAPEVNVEYSGTSYASGSSFNFGNVTGSTQNTGTTYKTFTITNTGSATLNITSVVVGGTGYSLYGTAPTSVAAGGSATVTVAMGGGTSNPATRTGTLTINNNDSNEGAYVVNLTGSVVSCATSITASQVLQDFEGNNNIIIPSTSAPPASANWSAAAINPSSGAGSLNTSPICGKLTRVATATYVQLRYTLGCGSTGNFDLTNPIVSMLIYSPAAGIPVMLSPKNSGGNVILSDYSSDAKTVTTKANQWERIYFDMTKIQGNTTVRYFDIMIDWTPAAGSPNRDYYIDDIKYDEMACVTSLPSSQVFVDYDGNRNLSVVWTNGTLNEFVANPSKVAPNTSNNVASFLRPSTGKYQGFRFAGCQNKIDLTNKSTISMLVYAGAANIPVQMALKTTGDVLVQGVTQKTTVAGWQKMYFDFSASKNAANIGYMDIFPDTGGVFTSNLTYYLDDIKYDILPCPTGPTVTAGGATTFCDGGSVVLTSSAVTGATGYVWKLNGTAIATATSTSYTANSSGDYTITATAPGGCMLTSTATTVTVNPIPVVPTVAAGGPTTFCTGGSVTLTGSTATSGVTYQWNNAGTPMATATNATFNVTASGTYTITVSKAGCSSTSTPATTVTVNTLPAVPTATAGGATTFCSGGSVTLTGSTTTSGVTYQWNNAGTAIGTATNATYSAATSGTYTVTVTKAGCSSTSTPAITVTVNSTPAIPTVTAGGATSFCTGGSVTLTGSTTTSGVTYQWNNAGSPIATATNATYTATASGTYTLTVSKSGCSSTSTSTTVTVGSLPATPTIAAGGPTTFCSGGSVTLTGSTTTGGVTYQWNNAGNPIATATNATYNATASGTYTVTVSTGCSATSTATTVTVNPAPAIPTVTAGGATSFCTGGSVILTGTTTTSGVTYQWNNAGSPIATATNATYTATASGTYTLTVSKSGCSATSTSTTVTVGSLPATPTVAAGGPTTFCSGGSVTLTGSTTTGGVTYQWNNAGNPIATATNATYNATTSGTYTITVSTGCSATSTATTVTVNPAPAVPTVSAGGVTTFCTGGSVVLTGATTTSGVTYQWKNAGTSVATATNATYTATTSGTYTLEVSKAGCSSVSTPAITVTVNPIPAVPTVSAGGTTTFCAGGSVMLTGSTTTSGVTYQWKNSNSNIATATSATYNATTSGTYTLEVSKAGCSSVSTPATTVTVNSSPAVPTISASGPTSFCSGSSVTLTGTTSTGGVTYQWSNGVNPIANATNATYNATASGDYIVKVSLGTCSSTSVATAVTVTPAGATASVSINNTSGLACPGVAITFTATATAGGSTPTYQWMVNSSIVGTNSSTYAATSLAAGDIVKCTMTSSLTCSSGSPATSNSIVIGSVGTSPCIAPAVKTINGPASVSPSQTATYSVSAATEGSTYNWIFPSGTIITSANSDSSIVNVTLGNVGGTVMVKETNPFGTTSSSKTVAVISGVVSQMLNAAFTVSPNPASGLFNVNLSDAFQGAINMKVVNTLGETVYSNSTYKTGSVESYQVDLNNLPAGIYLLEIESADGLAVKRLVKQ